MELDSGRACATPPIDTPGPADANKGKTQSATPVREFGLNS